MEGTHAGEATEQKTQEGEPEEQGGWALGAARSKAMPPKKPEPINKVFEADLARTTGLLLECIYNNREDDALNELESRIVGS